MFNKKLKENVRVLTVENRRLQEDNKRLRDSNTSAVFMKFTGDVPKSLDKELNRYLKDAGAFGVKSKDDNKMSHIGIRFSAQMNVSHDILVSKDWREILFHTLNNLNHEVSHYIESRAHELARY